MPTFRILAGDVMDGLRSLPTGSVRCCVTSPPYWGLRDYGHAGQIGLEPTPEAYVAKMVEVFREVRRVLAEDGTVWLNLGDSYASSAGMKVNHPQQSRNGQQGVVGPREKHPSASRANLSAFKEFGDCKPKDLVGIPWRVAFALQADGWWLRQDIVWAKPNPMPESVTDRCTKAHEYVFLLSKAARYYYDSESVKEGDAVYVRKGTAGGHKLTQQEGYKGIAGGTLNRDPAEPYGFSRDITTIGRNRRSVWTIATQPFPGAHFAVMPEALVEPCVLAGSAVGDTVLDPFAGSGTVGVVALRHERHFVGCELNPAYAEMAKGRIRGSAPLLNTDADEVAA